MGAIVEGPISLAFVSYPSLFKHLAFDGSFLHGVPEILARKDHEEQFMEGRPEGRGDVAERYEGRDWHSENDVSGAAGRRGTAGPASAVDAATVGQRVMQVVSFSFTSLLPTSKRTRKMRTCFAHFAFLSLAICWFCANIQVNVMYPVDSIFYETIMKGRDAEIHSHQVYTTSIFS